MSRPFPYRPAAVPAGRRRRVSPLRAVDAAEARPLFEEIPPEASGIRWVHDNAASAEHYLPETMGPGCAFLDYDNDGWMDIFLVNSGPCDFYKPPKPDPQRALQEQSRRHLHRRHRKGRASPANTFGMGVAVGDYDNDGFPDLFVTAYGRPHSLSQQRQRHLHRRERKGRAGREAVREPLDHQRGLVRFRQRRPAGSVRLQLRGLRQRPATSPAATTSWASTTTAFRACSRAPRSLLFHNNGDGTFTEVGRGTDIEKALGKGLGVVATDINNDGRMDLFVANDTVQNFLFVNRGPDANGKTKWEEIALAAEVGFSDRRAGALRHGRGRRRFRRRRLAGSVRRQRGSGDVLALQEHEERDLPRCGLQEPGGAGHPPAERLGTASSSITTTTARSI